MTLGKRAPIPPSSERCSGAEIDKMVAKLAEDYLTMARSYYEDGVHFHEKTTWSMHWVEL